MKLTMYAIKNKDRKYLRQENPDVWVDTLPEVFKAKEPCLFLSLVDISPQDNDIVVEIEIEIAKVTEISEVSKDQFD